MNENEELREKQLSIVNGGLRSPVLKREEPAGNNYIHKKEPGGNEEILRRKEEDA